MIDPTGPSSSSFKSADLERNIFYFTSFQRPGELWLSTTLEDIVLFSFGQGLFLLALIPPPISKIAFPSRPCRTCSGQRYYSILFSATFLQSQFLQQLFPKALQLAFGEPKMLCRLMADSAVLTLQHIWKSTAVHSNPHYKPHTVILKVLAYMQW